MDLDAFNTFCQSLPATHHVVQWGGAHVWKVDTKVFAIGGWSDNADLAITFKVSEFAYDILRDTPGCRPAPYLASRGLKWIQHFEQPGLNDDELKDDITESHRLASLNLTKKRQKELGLNQD